jgi:hypothetical protein
MVDIAKRHVNKAKKLVRDKFPEMAGVEPSLSEKRSHSKRVKERHNASANEACKSLYVLTFEREVSLPGGGRLKRLVRVTMDDSGEVVKLMSSK